LLDMRESGRWASSGMGIFLHGRSNRARLPKAYPRLNKHHRFRWSEPEASSSPGLCIFCPQNRCAGRGTLLSATRWRPRRKRTMTSPAECRSFWVNRDDAGGLGRRCPLTTFSAASESTGRPSIHQQGNVLVDPRGFLGNPEQGAAFSHPQNILAKTCLLDRRRPWGRT